MDTSFDKNAWEDSIEKTEDHEFLRNPQAGALMTRKSELKIGYDFKKLQTQSLSLSQLDLKGNITHDETYLQMLQNAFDKVHPLFYLNTVQRKFLLEKIIIMKLDKKVLLYSGRDDCFDDGSWACFILLQGEVHFFNNKESFLDLVNDISLFGYDGPIFQKRFATVIAEKNSILGMINRKDFLQLIHPYSQFATYISRNIRYKDKVLDDLQSFKNYVISFIDKGPINMKRLIDLYRKINSCLHSKCNSEEIDISAWTYALNRLPQNVIETYIFVLINKQPRLMSLQSQLGNLRIPRMKTNARNRDVYQYLEGKNVIVMRDMETDVLDFISNLCIHFIESTKLRKHIYSPITIREILESNISFEETLQVLIKKTGIYVSDDDSEILKKVFGDSFAKKLINLCINFQDVSVSICKARLNDKDPIEFWTQNLWTTTKELLGVTSWLSEIDDLVVDIFQGSKRTLLNCITCHLYMHKEEIFKWAKDNNIKLKTQKFLNENDKLIAYSFYYYQAFPEKDLELKEMNKKNGIVIIENTYGTGVNVLLINVNKLNKEFVDPSITVKSTSKNHIIVQLGYTFGNQSHDIIKPVLMLFGDKARSLNIIGKCGGLVGNRSDIIVANKIFLDKTHELVSINHGELNIEQLKKTAGTDIHLGPMLTVAGTILQNYELLNYYKHVMGCVGLEMEGYYFAKEIENSAKHNLIHEKFIMRMFYYISDLPLDPGQVLSQEGVAVSWDEGIGSMNAIQRHILNQIMLN